MGGRLALASADIEVTDGEPCEGCGVRVMGQQLVLTRDGQVLLDTQGVATVQRLSQRAWRITMTDGTVYDAYRKPGCSTCGGARTGRSR